jgi:hypothetical protein
VSALFPTGPIAAVARSTASTSRLDADSLPTLSNTPVELDLTGAELLATPTSPTPKARMNLDSTARLPVG